MQYRWKSFDDLDASLDLDKIEIPPFKFRIANLASKMNRKVKRYLESSETIRQNSSLSKI